MRLVSSEIFAKIKTFEGTSNFKPYEMQWMITKYRKIRAPQSVHHMLMEGVGGDVFGSQCQILRNNLNDDLQMSFKKHTFAK